jgi:hypothetical protein
LLALALAVDRGRHLRIGSGQIIAEKTGGMLGQWRSS